MGRAVFVIIVALMGFLAIINGFSGYTLYTMGDILVKNGGTAADLAKGLGYLMYVMAIFLVDIIIVGFMIFLGHYKLYTYEKMAEEG